MPNVITCLGFNNQAEEAVTFYTSVIKNSRIVAMTRAGKGIPIPEGSLLAALFTLGGDEFMAINGGPDFKHSFGMSMVLKCDTQAELDSYWTRLSDGGQEIECGWLTDRFGVPWQIIPRQLPEWLRDQKTADAVMPALLTMKKLDIATLQRAADAA